MTHVGAATIRPRWNGIDRSVRTRLDDIYTGLWQAPRAGPLCLGRQRGEKPALARGRQACAHTPTPFAPPLSSRATSISSNDVRRRQETQAPSMKHLGPGTAVWPAAGERAGRRVGRADRYPLSSLSGAKKLPTTSGWHCGSLAAAACRCARERKACGPSCARPAAKATHSHRPTTACCSTLRGSLFAHPRSACHRPFF